MRLWIICATLITTIGLGGCFWHHQQAVVAEPMAPPLKLGPSN
jgi:hypothetical protein